jgi:uncharacterized protein (DUF433 family)
MERVPRKIRAKEVVRDITAGVTDPQLMDKYELTPDQLEFLLQQLLNKGLVTQELLDSRLRLSDTAITKAFVDVQQSIQELDESDAPAGTSQEPAPSPKGKGKTKVKAKEIVKDIRERLTDDEIIAKYGMNDKQFEFILRQLVDTGRIAPEEMHSRASLSHSSISRAFVDVYQFLYELEQ